jgi:HlyD family secretion protein
MMVELFLIIGLVGGSITWAATSNISGAVVASGSVKVEQGSQKIQHAAGGIISDIMVKEGDAVSAGDILVRLETKNERAELAIFDGQFYALVAREARLRAERDGQPFDASSVAREKGEAVAAFDEIIRGETRLFDARHVALVTQKEILNERKNQFASEIKGNTVQIDAKQKEIELLQLELKGVEDLYSANLASVARVMPLRRELARAQGDLNVLASQIQQLTDKIGEVSVQITAVDQERVSEIDRDLQEIRPKITELENRRTIAREVVQRAEIHAPVSGFVSQLGIHTIGGVVGPGETLMLVVPRDSPLTIEASVTPSDIDQIRVGGNVTLRLTAFNRRVTPELTGVIATIAADSIRDERTGLSSYPIKISVAESEFSKLSGSTVLPGMNAEVFIETAQRSVLPYLLKPAVDQFSKVFREK